MHFKKTLLFFLFFCFFSCQLAIADETVDLKNEFAKLKADMQAMQSSYEKRIAVLEKSLASLEGTKESKKLSLVDTQITAYSKETSAAELPDISIVVDTGILFSDNENNENKDKLRVKHAELCAADYLHPEIMGNLVAAFEQEYEGSSVSTEVDLEEAYLTFLNLPLDFQGIVGRKLIDFGRLNPVHMHHWSFAEAPLVMQNFFGAHPWLDDGVSLSYLIPNPADLYFKFSAGVLNGKALGHAHSNTESAEAEVADASVFGQELIEWDGHIYNTRALLDVPFSDNLNGSFGTSVVVDDNSRNKLYGADFVLKYQWPNTYRKLLWHTEYFSLDESVRNIKPYGLFSYLQLTLDKYWETGLKYDWSNFADSEDYHAWAGSVFLTYYFTHTMYLRGEYQYKNHASGEKENQFFIQMVWGIGPHAHGLEE